MPLCPISFEDVHIYDPNAPSGSVTVTETLATQSNIFAAPSIQLSNTFTNTIFLPIALKNARPGFELITLLLTANDDLSGVDSAMISHTADFSASDWEVFGAIKNYWMPTNGSDTIFVKFRDRAGNVSEVYSTIVP